MYTYDVRSRLTELKTYDSGAVLRDTKHYVWDAASRITSATEGGVTATYGYDLIDQLTSEVKSALGYSASYTYDANGNRTTRTVNGVTETYAYDGADKLTTITGGGNPRTFTYDLAGRTKTIVAGAGTTLLNYDFEGRVTDITYPNTTYDAFTYNGSGARVSSSGVNGSKSFRRSGTGVTSPLMSDGSSNYTSETSVRTGSTTKYQHGGLKNTTDQTDSSQSVTASRHYDAFGNLISTSGSWSGIHGYAGSYGYQEDSNGLKLLGHRYYDSDTGRFLSEDPIEDGNNWFTYASSSPITHLDATGLSDGSKPGPEDTRYRTDLSQKPAPNMHIYHPDGSESIITANGGERMTHHGQDLKKLSNGLRKKLRPIIRKFVKAARKVAPVLVIYVLIDEGPMAAARGLIYADEIELAFALLHEHVGQPFANKLISMREGLYAGRAAAAGLEPGEY